MQLDRYSPDDSPMIRNWLATRKMLEEEFITELPRTGVICRVDDYAVAAGFLRYVEGNFAILDSLITNPVAKSYLRNIGIDAVVKELIGIAKKHGIKKIMAFSVDNGILDRSKNHGFLKSGHTIITLNVDSQQTVIEGI